MSLVELLDRTAVEQAQLLREGQISSEELVRLYLDRIVRLNPRLNAFVEVLPALAAARQKDAQRRRSTGSLPMFHGVPLGIKDLNVVRWTVTRWGSRAVPHLRLPLDDRTVAPLRRAGFVMLGKLATAEFGAMPVTEPDIHPPTRNPWSPAHSAGGSSGGSGAAVASAMLPAAQGSDGAGSLRIPAAFCHLFTIKPSRGRVRNQFGLSDERLLYTSGPITRSVEDAAAMLDVMAGLVDGRPHRAPIPRRSFRELARERPRRMKIRFVTSTRLCPTHPEIGAALLRSLKLLAELGHEVEEGTLPDATLEEFLPLWAYQVARTPFVRWTRTQPITRWLGEAGRQLRAADVAVLHDRLNARFAAALATADVWAMPTVPLPAPLVGTFGGMPPSDAFASAGNLGAFTAVANVTGHPAASVPMGLTDQGLPMGMQLIGTLFGEGDLLALSHELELAMPWRHRRPPFLD